MTVRARFDGKVFVPIDPVDCSKDQMVELEIRATKAVRRRSPAQLRQLMREGTPLEAGDAAAMEAAITSGKKAVRFGGAFDAADKA